MCRPVSYFDIPRTRRRRLPHIFDATGYFRRILKWRLGTPLQAWCIESSLGLLSCFNLYSFRKSPCKKLIIIIQGRYLQLFQTDIGTNPSIRIFLRVTVLSQGSLMAVEHERQIVGKNALVTSIGPVPASNTLPLVILICVVMPYEMRAGYV